MRTISEDLTCSMVTVVNNTVLYTHRLLRVDCKDSPTLIYTDYQTLTVK